MFQALKLYQKKMKNQIDVWAGNWFNLKPAMFILSKGMEHIYNELKRNVM